MAKSPFKIESIQVDGGSEFTGEFEQACCEVTGRLERFYDRASLCDTLSALRNELAKAVTKYNTYRPHATLAGRTPMEYIRNLELEASV